jgi:hypothetical protein
VRDEALGGGGALAPSLQRDIGALTKPGTNVRNRRPNRSKSQHCQWVRRCDASSEQTIFGPARTGGRTSERLSQTAGYPAAARAFSTSTAMPTPQGRYPCLSPATLGDDVERATDISQVELDDRRRRQPGFEGVETA